uniref:Putative beta-2-glycoprotein i n=1 Tax=Panstrongylus lignarius TaxID=156445 RepID=A0A224XWB4_9HEMI
MGAGAALLHISAFFLYLYVIYFLHVQNAKKALISEDKTIKTIAIFSRRFLTNWTFAIQEIYFFICILQHLLSLLSANKIKDKLTKYSDYLFTSIATPMALMVSIVFWAIFVFDRELIFPKVLDQVIPVWINHCIHTFNSVIPVVDMFLINHKFPTWSKALQGTLTYLLIYSICIFGTYFQTGIWLYPLFAVLNWPQRILLCVGVFVVAAAMYGLTKVIHHIIWGSVTVAPEKSKKGSKHKRK